MEAYRPTAALVAATMLDAIAEAYGLPTAGEDTLVVLSITRPDDGPALIELSTGQVFSIAVVEHAGHPVL